MVLFIISEVHATGGAMDIQDCVQKSGQPKLGIARRCYSQPQLTLLGDVRTLTETGSMAGNEGVTAFGTCFPFNGTFDGMTYSTTNNMC